jgi:hypothetical protein
MHPVEETASLDPGREALPERDMVVLGAGAPARAPGGDRGPVPEGVAAPGWREGEVSSFTSDTLYEKINGRAGYYQSFGVQRLYFLSLVHEQSETTIVDIEMYDHGTVANALGAYAGERQPDTTSEVEGGSIGHSARNALFMVRGRYYIRAIGADESEPVLAQLQHLRSALNRKLDAEPLPWAFSLFVGQLGVDPGTIGYVPENAFSLGFARHVYTAALDEDGMELFVAAAAAGDAAALAAQFTDGFASYGSAAGNEDGVRWIEDRYLDTVAGVSADRSLVVGVRGMPDKDTARAWLGKLRAAAGAMPEAVLQQAVSAAAARTGGGGYDDDAEAGEGDMDDTAGPAESDVGGAEPGYDDEPGH